MNHVKGLIFQPWPPARKMPAVVRRSPDPWLQGSLCHILCWPTGHYNATLKLILCLSVCVDFWSHWRLTLLFFIFGMGFMWLSPALRLRCNPSALAGFKCKLWSWNTKSCWVKNSQFDWKLTEYSRNLSIHICSYESSKVDENVDTKKGVKGFIGSFTRSSGTHRFWQCSTLSAGWNPH